MLRLTLLLLLATSAVPAASRIYLVQDDPGPISVLARFLNAHGHAASVEDQATFRRHLNTISAEAVFMYVHGAFDPAIEARLIRYAKSGGRLIILHHGIASGRMRDRRWMPFLGVKIFPRDDPVFPWKVLRGDYQFVNLAPGHYVTSHHVDYPLTVTYTPSDAPSTGQRLPALLFPATEIFLNQVFTDGRRKKVLFGFKTRIGGKLYMQDRAGWMMRTGKGYVFYFQPGHRAADFANRNYAQILLNAVEWRPSGRRAVSVIP